VSSPQFSVYSCEQPGLSKDSDFAPSSICQSISRCNDTRHKGEYAIGQRFFLVANFAVLMTDKYRQDQLENVVGNSMAIIGQP
jgi:hypothetical protein